MEGFEEEEEDEEEDEKEESENGGRRYELSTLTQTRGGHAKGTDSAASPQRRACSARLDQPDEAPLTPAPDPPSDKLPDA